MNRSGLSRFIISGVKRLIFWFGAFEFKALLKDPSFLPFKRSCLKPRG